MINHLITGPMFAGKSKFLIKELNYNLIDEDKQNILFLYPQNTFRGYFCRDTTIKLESKIEIASEDSIVKMQSADELAYTLSKYDVVGIDEFCLLENPYIFIEAMKINRKTDFCIASLDRDSKKQEWESVSLLIASDLLDIETKIKGLCDCGKKAIYTKRIIDDGEQIIIGDTIYKCCCASCY